jgi:hypothetical protein
MLAAYGKRVCGGWEIWRFVREERRGERALERVSASSRKKIVVWEIARLLVVVARTGVLLALVHLLVATQV